MLKYNWDEYLEIVLCFLLILSIITRFVKRYLSRRRDFLFFFYVFSDKTKKLSNNKLGGESNISESSLTGWY